MAGQRLITRLRDVVAAKDEMLAARDHQIEALGRKITALADRVEQLERQAGRDSSNSSRPPSSDSPYDRDKRRKDRSLRGRSGRKPGKQPGTSGSTMKLADDPDEVIECPPAECSCCGADLAGEPVTAQQRRQVREITPPPPPKTTEYLVQAKVCARCGTTSAGQAPGYARGPRKLRARGARAGREPGRRAPHPHLPLHGGAGSAGGIAVSTGWMAGVRGKAAAKLEPFIRPPR